MNLLLMLTPFFASFHFLLCLILSEVSTPALTRQRKFMPTFWTFRHAALNDRWTPGAREGSAVGYVKSEAALRTSNYSLSLGQSESLRFDP